LKSPVVRFDFDFFARRVSFKLCCVKNIMSARKEKTSIRPRGDGNEYKTYTNITAGLAFYASTASIRDVKCRRVVRGRKKNGK